MSWETRCYRLAGDKLEEDSENANAAALKCSKPYFQAATMLQPQWGEAAWSQPASRTWSGVWETSSFYAGQTQNFPGQARICGSSDRKRACNSTRKFTDKPTTLMGGGAWENCIMGTSVQRIRPGVKMHGTHLTPCLCWEYRGLGGLNFHWNLECSHLQTLLSASLNKCRWGTSPKSQTGNSLNRFGTDRLPPTSSAWVSSSDLKDWRLKNGKAYGTAMSPSGLQTKKEKW